MNNDYGIWMGGSKIKSEIVNTPPSAYEKRKAGSHLKPHLSLSSSITNKHIRANDSTLSPSFNHESHK